MVNTLKHRGPDDHGVWIDHEGSIAFGHRRLSILDLSEAGHQPMESFCGRYVITFNGEVYNFQQIRDELERQDHTIPFRGNSDTEVMLAAISTWGLELAVSKFIGMFAFGLWDKRDKTLHLVRDRIGIKPLYYGWAGRDFVFASELKAFRVHPHFSADISDVGASLYFRNMYIPAPYSIFRFAYKVPAGHILALKAAHITGMAKTAPLPSEPYWSALEKYRKARSLDNGRHPDVAIRELEALLIDSVRLRMVADVPMGTLLSGGIDSSLVTALMQSQSSRKIKTFSIGFEDKNYNEATFAARVATALGADHTELYVHHREVVETIHDIPFIYDEPFADSSQIPPLLVSRLARKEVTVALSGDGGDELFLGYPRYKTISSFWRLARRVPLPLRKAVSRLASYPGFDTAPYLKRTMQLTRYLASRNLSELYDQVTAVPKGPPEQILCALHPLLTDREREQQDGWDDLQFMSYLDVTKYLPDDILVKVDRASMSVALEVRTPLLDHRVVEFAAQLSPHVKMRHGMTKWPLRAILGHYLPINMFDRPKQGFAIPLGEWLRGPLREWGQNILDACSIQRYGLLDSEKVKRLFDEHTSGQCDRGSILWAAIVFQAWMDDAAS
jgi:asparagine synthase (glutamine-hydrolysing)